MIGKIKGVVSEIEGNIGLIETASGLFYRVFLTPEIVGRYGVGSPLEIYTYLHVKEDGLTLFGFEDKNKYTLFTMLLSTDGVGPKLAFTIISFTNATQIIEAVTNSDLSFFSGIPGIGKKTAQKILLELSGKFNSEFVLSTAILSAEDKTVVDALVSLGFDKRQAHGVIDKLDKGISLELKIKQSIQLLTQK